MSSTPNNSPLFSTLLSFFALILLSFPRLLWRFLFSPVFLLAGFLLLSLLRLAATNHSNNQSNPTPLSTSHAVPDKDRRRIDAVTEGSEAGGDVSCACFEESFVQWNVRAPLEVIYEEYGEGEDLNDSDPEPRQVRIGIERYPSLSLSLYYPATDSDSSSEDEDNVCFMWDDEDEERDELIEIALDKTNNKKPSSDHQFDLLFEEENLIEIDISPTRNDEFSDVKLWMWRRLVHA